MHFKGTLKVADWNEADVTGHIFRVSAAFTTEGEITGSIRVEYMMYTMRGEVGGETAADSTAYRGFLVFRGEINGKSGTFAMADAGIYTEKGPESRFTVLPGTGTDGFKGIAGYGKYFPNKEVIGIEMELEIE
jgi:hypothetical protein